MDIRTTYSPYLKSAHLEGHEPIVTIASCAIEEVGQRKDKCPVVKFVGKDKGMVLNVTNSKALEDAYGYDTNGWIGKQVQLFVVQVTMDGVIKDGLRVRMPAPAAPVAAAPAPPAPTSNDPDDVIPF